MRKNPHGRILKREPKEQHLSTVTKSCYSLNTIVPNYAVILRKYIYKTLSDWS